MTTLKAHMTISEQRQTIKSIKISQRKENHTCRAMQRLVLKGITINIISFLCQFSSSVQNIQGILKLYFSMQMNLLENELKYI